MKRTSNRVAALNSAKVDLERRLAEAVEERSDEIGRLAVKAGLAELAIPDAELLGEFAALAARFRDAARAAKKQGRDSQTLHLEARPPRENND